MAAGKSRWWRSRRRLAASREVGKVRVRRIDRGGAQIPLGLLLVREIAWVVVSEFVKVEDVGGKVGRAIRIARFWGNTGVRKWVGPEILGLLKATGIREIRWFGMVVRSLAGRLVLIGSSMPAHAGPRLCRGGDCHR
jgi:hypothetical protein